MKTVIYTIVLLLIAAFGFGQSLVTSNKEWSNVKIDPFNPNNVSTEYLKFTNDTMVNGQSYKIVQRSTDENQQNWSFYGYIREDSAKKVYFRFNATESEYLFYNFNIQLYDTITAYSVHSLYENLFISSQLYFVVSVDSILIGEGYRRQINLGFIEDSTYTFEHWIDSTGNIGGLLHSAVMLVPMDGYALLCFSEDGIVKYHHPYTDSCYVLTGFDDMHSYNTTVRISPNPFSESTTLIVEHSNWLKDMQIDFYDLTGRIVYSKTFFSEIRLTRNEFNPGIYFYKISYGYGNILTGKIIVN